jgi:hypothetical protein
MGWIPLNPASSSPLKTHGKLREIDRLGWSPERLQILGR